VKIKFEGIDVDIWPLEKTWAFESGSVNLNDINSLSETTFLNIESIAIELFPKSKCRNVIAHGFNQAINDKLLEINLKENPFPELNIARALYAAKRLEYNFGPHLIEFISENLKSCDIDDILHIYEKKYGIVEFEKNSYRNYLTQIKISDDFYHNDLKSFKRSYSKQTNIFDKEPSSTRMKV
ncbi:hypothetical protein, partial [Fulvivirga sp.]|uniref:hypothetical protein n=1 Tax=Fulvivirga sp. TaxID=1931237 RepID=UPI0032EF9ACF